MSTLVELQKSQVCEPPLNKPLDEVVWDAWIAKNAEQERRGRSTRARAVKWILIVGLFALAGLWYQVTPSLMIIIKFVVAAGATLVMVQALDKRQYAFAAVFGAIALLYNPLVPVLSFSGELQRGLVAATAAPFIASLATPPVRLAHNA